MENGDKLKAMRKKHNLRVVCHARYSDINRGLKGNGKKEKKDFIENLERRIVTINEDLRLKSDKLFILLYSCFWFLQYLTRSELTF